MLRLFIHIVVNLFICIQCLARSFKTQVILAHVVHVHTCFNAKFFVIAVPGWNFELLITAGAVYISMYVCFFPNLNSLLLWRSCDTSKMIFGLLIWEGNIYLHSFTFWLSLISQVINEGSSCFDMKISSLFVCFCLAWNCFFFLMDDKEEKRASVVFCQEFYPNWDAL